MAKELRKTGISVVGDVPWGTHFCFFYETTQDLLDTLVPYFIAGLKSKEFCLWIISKSELITSEEAKEALRQSLPDLERYLAEGRIEIVSHEEWFQDRETFDLHRVANRFKEKLDEALARGYAGMRINGGPAWLQKKDSKQFLEFEQQLENLFPKERMIASCTYPLATTNGDELFDVTWRHQFAIVKRRGQWEVYETPESKQAKAEIERLNEELEQRVTERTNKLRATNQELRREITERSRVEGKLNETSGQLRALSARLQWAREEEGTRIAREIHDELGSSLTSLKWDLEEIDKLLSTPLEPSALAAVQEKLHTPMKLADSAITAVRRIASELRPSVLDDLGLVAAIEWQSQQFQTRTGIVCVCDCSVERVELTDEQSTALFRVLQEALTNVLRHAQATRVDIKINKESGHFILSISDNGKGITEKEKSEQQSLGILGMRERVHLIGGEIDIKGVDEKGTVIIVRVPTASGLKTIR